MKRRAFIQKIGAISLMAAIAPAIALDNTTNNRAEFNVYVDGKHIGIARSIPLTCIEHESQHWHDNS